jgi:hypothetical protein
MLLTISFALQPGIVALVIVNALTAEVREPGLDVPSRDEHGDPFIGPAGRNSSCCTFFIKLPNPYLSTAIIAIDHHNECLANLFSLTAPCLDLNWISSAHELFGRSAIT